MGRRNLARRAGKLVAAASAVVAIAAGGAFTASALTGDVGSTDVIHACSNPGNGNLRLVSTAAQCRQGERALDWNVVGPQGQKGDTGPQGPAGPGLVGSACTAGGVEGTVAVAFASDGSGSIRCDTGTSGGGTTTTTTTGQIDCGTPPPYPNGSAACDHATGAFVYVCNAGWGDANGNLADGCEVDLRTDPHNCGSVGMDITNWFPNAFDACVNGAAVMTACKPGWYDANGNPADGCESSTPPAPLRRQ